MDRGDVQEMGEFTSPSLGQDIMPDFKDPLPDFSDVTGGSSSTAPGAPKSAAPGPRTYTVVKGDSLSRIAKALYGSANKWHTLYEANKAVIGSNPDLIKPGQVLTIPDA
jgi:nucleoid-associated protein YgaU